MDRAEILGKFRARYTVEQSAMFEKALQYAEDVHHNQRRESGEPYIIHPIAVADIVMGHGYGCGERHRGRSCTTWWRTDGM